MSPIQLDLVAVATAAAERINTLEMSLEESQEVLGDTTAELTQEKARSASLQALADEHAWWRWVLTVQLGEAQAALAECRGEHDDYAQGTYGEGTYGLG